MSAFDALAYAVGETTVFMVGHLVGRTFNLDRNKAQRIGEIIVMSILIGGLVVITLVYS